MPRKDDPPPSPCPLCGRECPAEILERHHLKTRRKDRTDVAEICRECHKTIHGLFSLTDLRNPALGLDTIEGLLEDDRFRRALGHIRKLAPGAFMRMRRSRRNRRR